MNTQSIIGIAAGAVFALCLMSTTHAADTPVAAIQSPIGEVILHNGKVAVSTEDGAYRFAEAVAIADGRIEAVGDSQTLLQDAEDTTRKIDLQGRTVIPGLNDSHAHAVRGGRYEMTAAGIIPVTTNTILGEMHRTWNRPDAAKWGALHSELVPEYRAVAESYNRAQDAAK